MGIYFEVRNQRVNLSKPPDGTNNRHAVGEEQGAAEGESEQTTLLGNER